MDTILIIDDDININNMLCETLQNEGYAVLRAYSGPEAMMLLSDKKPDLILLDLMLPGLSGEQLLPKIEDIPVIVVSAKADTANKVDLLLAGADVDNASAQKMCGELGAKYPRSEVIMVEGGQPIYNYILILE